VVVDLHDPGVIHSVRSVDFTEEAAQLLSIPREFGPEELDRSLRTAFGPREIDLPECAGPELLSIVYAPIRRLRSIGLS